MALTHIDEVLVSQPTLPAAPRCGESRDNHHATHRLRLQSATSDHAPKRSPSIQVRRRCYASSGWASVSIVGSHRCYT